MTSQDNTKSCSSCKKILDLSMFYKRGNRYRSHCISCIKSKRIDRLKNKSISIPEYKTCSSCSTTKSKSEFHKNKTVNDGLSSICKSCKKRYDRQNKDRFLDRKRSSPASTTEYRRKWNTENADIKRLYTANRRAKIKSATPVFADMDEIKAVYKNCPTGMEVDHIVPITSKIVCGLHVHWNMQYLTRAENISKGNKHEL